MPRARNAFGEVIPGYYFTRFSSEKEVEDGRKFLIKEHRVAEKWITSKTLDIQQRTIYNQERTAVLAVSPCTLGLFYKAETDLFSKTIKLIHLLDTAIGPVSIKALLTNDTEDSVEMVMKWYPKADPVKLKRVINALKRSIKEE